MDRVDLFKDINFENYFSFPTGTTWDDDEGYYEMDIDLELADDTYSGFIIFEDMTITQT